MAINTLDEDSWDAALADLAHADAVFAGLIPRLDGQRIVSRGDPFETLLRSIVGQQISVKAASSIWTRLATQLGQVTPLIVLQHTQDQLRACGLSARKALYVHDLASKFLDQTVNPAHWQGLTDAQVVQELTQIKGVGRWTAEMVLMFNMLRPDVFPIDDLAIQKAMRLNYGFSDSKQDQKAMVVKAQLWAPWRTVASWLLWRSLELEPLETSNY